MAVSGSDSDQTTEELVNDFLESRGHEVRTREWKEEYAKKQCPECGGIHAIDATQCESCGWKPIRNR